MKNNNKIYGMLILLKIAQSNMPKIGDVLDIEPISCPSDNLAAGVVGKNGKEDIFLAKRQVLIDQVTNYKISQAAEWNVIGLVQAKIVDLVQITLMNGAISTAAIIEADIPEEKTKSVKKIAGLKTYQFSGNKIEFPAKESLYIFLEANKTKEDEINKTYKFSVVREDSKLYLLANGEKVGENIMPSVLKDTKDIIGKEVTVIFNKAAKGDIFVSIDTDDLKLDINGVFDEQEKHAASLGIDKVTFDKYINAFIHFGIEIPVIKKVINSWKDYSEEVNSRILSLDAAINNENGKENYIYVDTEEIIHDIIAYTMSEYKFNIRLIGEPSTGKNTALNTAAVLLRRPMYRLNFHEDSDASVTLGNATIDKDGCLAYQDSLVIQAMKNGGMLILDEVNGAAPGILLTLQPLLEENGCLDLKEQGIIKAEEGFQIFLTMNRTSEMNAGTNDMAAPFESRLGNIEIKNRTGIKDILTSKCHGASQSDIDKVSKIYSALYNIVQDKTKSFPEGFIAARGYIAALNGPKEISLKKRCIQYIANLKTGEEEWPELVIQTINDIFG